MTTNPSGIEPLEYNVLVKTYEVPKKTAGGIILPDAHHERVQWAETRGTVIAVSPIAFNYENDAPRAAVGDEVLFSKHAGTTVKGADEKEYRMVKDKDILARLVAHV